MLFATLIYRLQRIPRSGYLIVTQVIKKTVHFPVGDQLFLQDNNEKNIIQKEKHYSLFFTSIILAAILTAISSGV